MQAFVLIALLPLALADLHGHHAIHRGHHAVHHAPAYGAPAYGAPAYSAPAYHASAYHAPAYHAPAYGPPKENCSVVTVVEPAEVCTPAFETVCAPVELPVKLIVDREQCYDVTRTVCTESVEVIPQEICTYKYQKKEELTTAKTVSVSFEKVCDTQMVTVCAPAQTGYGYGHGHGYGHNYCKEVAQETCYNVPVVTVEEPEFTVSYPEPIKQCVSKPINIVRVSCEDIVENRCIIVPEVEESTISIEKCIVQLATPDCQDIELSLPKQVCKEINYGYAEDTHHHEPATYAPEFVVPAYTEAPATAAA